VEEITVKTKQPVKWFRCTCGCERLVKSVTENCNVYQPVLFRRIRPNSFRTRTGLGKVKRLPMRIENGFYVPHLEHYGYYCPDCWTYWGATFAEVRKNRKQYDQKKYDDAISTWHLLPELREEPPCTL